MNQARLDVRKTSHRAPSYGVAAAAFILFAASMVTAQQDLAAYRAFTPAGGEVVLLKPSGAEITLLGLAECKELEGAQQVDHGLQARVVKANGAPMERFPKHFSFRVTATLRKTLIEEPGSVLKTNEEPALLLTRLKFKLKAYDGLQVRVIEPDSSVMIGVPVDVPYDERIYRVTFHLSGNEPPTTRFVLEVAEPKGERLARLHFSLL